MQDAHDQFAQTLSTARHSEPTVTTTFALRKNLTEDASNAINVGPVVSIGAEETRAKPRRDPGGVVWLTSS